jgi:hypothetical protein
MGCSRNGRSSAAARGDVRVREKVMSENEIRADFAERLIRRFGNNLPAVLTVRAMVDEANNPEVPVKEPEEDE